MQNCVVLTSSDNIACCTRRIVLPMVVYHPFRNGVTGEGLDGMKIAYGRVAHVTKSQQNTKLGCLASLCLILVDEVAYRGLHC